MSNLDYNHEEINDTLARLAANLDNLTSKIEPLVNEEMKRIKLPIPEEYGGGYVYGNGYSEAAKKLADVVKERMLKSRSGPLFKDCWEKWISLKEGQERSPSTISNYKWLATAYLLPFFGDKHIDEIDADDIQEFFNRMMRLSRSVSTQCRAVMNGIFDRAMRLKDITSNPMIYRYERSNKTGEKVVLQDEDLVEVIAHLEDLKATGDIRDYLYFCFLCFTSMRRGEILGLRWRDIDFVANEIHIRNNVTFPNGQNDPVTGAPKDDSYGVIHLSADLAAKIAPYVGKGYVIPYSSDQKTRPMTRSMFSKMWARCRKILNLKGATSHSFRASYATMMNAHCTQVDPKVLQGALRHKTPDLALKVYAKKNLPKTRKAEIEYDNWLHEQIAK